MKKVLLRTMGWIFVAEMLCSAVMVQETSAAKKVTSGNESSTIANESSTAQKAGKIESLNYIGGKTYALNIQYSEENGITAESIGETGILAAVSYDFDNDGKEEIFSVSYKDSTDSPTGRAIVFSVLKENDSIWNIISEQEMLYVDYQGQYREMSGMGGGTEFAEVSVFMRKINEQYQFFYEVYGEGTVATGQFWNLEGFYLENDELRKIETSTDIFYEGSPISELWDSELADEYAEENAAVMQAYNSLLFAKSAIGFDNMTVDQNSGMYQILRMKKSGLVSDEERGKWVSDCYNGNKPDAMKCYSYKINDMSSDMPDIIQEYTADAVTEDRESTQITKESTSSEYIIPDSDSRYLSRDEVSSMSLQQLNYAKNEIYARRGRIFNSPELRNYFESKSWYHGTISPDDFKDSDMLNDYERANTELLSQVEYDINPEGYPLDK